MGVVAPGKEEEEEEEEESEQVHKERYPMDIGLYLSKLEEKKCTTV